MANLLIVDDEEDVREFAANFFRRRKLEVSVASSGEEALTLIKDQVPDAIVLDITMPGLDGIETLRRIKEGNPGIKVIMVTGKSPEENNIFERCRELGALDYIHKPLQLDELEKVVAEALK